LRSCSGGGVAAVYAVLLAFVLVAEVVVAPADSRFLALLGMTKLEVGMKKLGYRK